MDCFLNISFLQIFVYTTFKLLIGDLVKTKFCNYNAWKIYLICVNLWCEFWAFWIPYIVEKLICKFLDFYFNHVSDFQYSLSIELIITFRTRKKYLPQLWQKFCTLANFMIYSWALFLGHIWAGTTYHKILQQKNHCLQMTSLKPDSVSTRCNRLTANRFYRLTASQF